MSRRTVPGSEGRSADVVQTMTRATTELPDATVARKPAKAGVPFRLHVGVTGHRTLPDGIDWTARVIAALHDVSSQLGATDVTPIVFTVVSSLAEGADRIVVAALVGDPRTRLEVPLPMEPRSYMQQFDGKDSCHEFERLLRLASRTLRAPDDVTGTRALQWAGQTVVSRSDIIVALWDDKPSRGRGGTEEIVSFARSHGRPVIHIITSDEGRVQILPAIQARVRRSRHRAQPRCPLAALRSALAGLDAYNHQAAEHVDDCAMSAADDGPVGDIDAAGARVATIWRPISAWLGPHFIRADKLANATRKRYSRVVWSLCLLPVLAVAAVAVQTQFFAQDHALFWVEVGALVAALGLVAVERWRHPHRQWITYRHLAERLRTACFLAPLESSDKIQIATPRHTVSFTDTEQTGAMSYGSSRVHGFHEFSVDWLPRLFDELWRDRPRLILTRGDVSVARTFLAQQWIGGQLSYHTHAAQRNLRRYRATTGGVAVLFAATIAIATLHASGAWDSHDALAHTADVLAVLPT